MAANPAFAATPRAASADVTTANTNVDGATGTYTAVFTAGSSGSRVDFVRIKGKVAAAATQAADTVRLFLFDGATRRLFGEQLVAAGGAVISVTQANYETTISLGITLPTGWRLDATTSVGGTTGIYVLTAFGGDF